MNKILKTLLFASPVIVTGIAVATYFVVSTKTNFSQSSNLQTNDKAVDLDQNIGNGSSSPASGSLLNPVNQIGVTIFPNLNQASYYKHVRVNDGKPEITFELIAYLVKDVLLKMQYTDGTVSWGYKYLNENAKDEVVVGFRVDPSRNGILSAPVVKFYHLKLSHK